MLLYPKFLYNLLSVPCELDEMNEARSYGDTELVSSDDSQLKAQIGVFEISELLSNEHKKLLSN